MQPTRRARLASAIQQELAQVIPREVKDPRVPPITLTSIEVTEDGSQATIFVAILGGAQGVQEGIPPLSEKGQILRMQDCLDGLTSASGFLRRYLAKAISVRFIPNLIFREDKGFENANRVHHLLKQLNTPSSDDKTGSG